MTAAQRKKNRKSVSVSVSIQISLSLALSLSLSLFLSLSRPLFPKRHATQRTRAGQNSALLFIQTQIKCLTRIMRKRWFGINNKEKQTKAAPPPMQQQHLLNQNEANDTFMCASISPLGWGLGTAGQHRRRVMRF